MVLISAWPEGAEVADKNMAPFLAQPFTVEQFEMVVRQSARLRESASELVVHARESVARSRIIMDESASLIADGNRASSDAIGLREHTIRDD